MAKKSDSQIAFIMHGKLEMSCKCALEKVQMGQNTGTAFGILLVFLFTLSTLRQTENSLRRRKNQLVQLKPENRSRGPTSILTFLKIKTISSSRSFFSFRVCVCVVFFSFVRHASQKSRGGAQ